MSYSFTVNQSPATGAEAMFNLKARLKLAGWTVLRSSDGTTYNSSGDQITVAGSGAGGMANNNAWFVIQSPAGAGSRQYLIQRSTTNTSWRMLYSASAGFSGGSPGATQTPSATDEQLLAGGGTHAAPTFTGFFNTDGSYRQQIGADNAAPYPFWMGCYPSGGGSPNFALVHDPVLNFPAEDQDPLVIYLAFAGSNVFQTSTIGALVGVNSSRCVAYLKKGLAGEGFVNLFGHAYVSSGSGEFGPTQVVANPHNNKDEGLPILYARGSNQSAPQGYKGVSRVMKWHGPTRTTGDTLFVSATKDRIIMAQVELPWDGVTTPTL